ncbi:hypothetical protein [Maribacter cobaltidurans]|uniref:Uncharacterized protein n=1 Tax=Maribacter cobaltidurans TaxID=1178778 RepID=A0A223V0W7_9FLAO|nr:hypothetical protein [Maribacter cobaltidurans]ASV29001.1 hypothetical protein CJ263_01455 [Maribacter cobaltidurans]GGD72814.1 hypothetical protein GCM10011412_08030 [Maribacter cobaltidurans]
MGKTEKKYKDISRKNINQNDIENLSDIEKTKLIYDLRATVRNLENDLEYKNNPINLLSENAENMISLIKETAENWLAIKKTSLGFSLKMAIFAFLIVGLIVGSAAWLTFSGKIDGSTFTFLLGLIVGYALTFLQNLINPPS